MITAFRTAPRRWPALVIEAAGFGTDDLVAAVLDDFGPTAIEDLATLPIPPGGLWDSTEAPLPDTPSAPLHWRVFFSDPTARDSAASALCDRIPGLSLERVEVVDEDWAARSQRSLTAIRAGSFVVAPPWDVPARPSPGVVTIIVEPSRGFGTGHHASTRLCLRALSALDVDGRRVLDLGTGSGVLALAAAAKGAREVTAIDIDADAIDAARATATLNALPIAIRFVVGDFRRGVAEGVPGSAPDLRDDYELVLANLTGGMLTSSAPQILGLVAPGGVLVLGGFDEAERPGVHAAFATKRRRAEYVEDGWVGLVLS